MKKKHSLFIDPRPILKEKEDFNLKKLKCAYQDLTEYFKVPIEELSKEHWNTRETTDKEKQKAIEKATTEKDVIEYYSKTRQHLYRLTLWEGQKDKQREYRKLYLLCKRFNIKKILDFGGGIGGLCIYLNRRALQCDYLDVPGETYNFARWRFNKYKTNTKVISTFDTLLSDYDAVIAYDVFEHIFDLPGTIKKIKDSLRPGGYLISKSTFGGGGVHLLKNKVYQDFRNFNNLLSDNGLDFIGRLKADRFSRLLNKIGLKYYLISIRLSKKLKYGGNFVVHRKMLNK